MFENRLSKKFKKSVLRFLLSMFLSSLWFLFFHDKAERLGKSGQAGLATTGTRIEHPQARDLPIYISRLGVMAAHGTLTPGVLVRYQ